MTLLKRSLLLKFKLALLAFSLIIATPGSAQTDINEKEVLETVEQLLWTHRIILVKPFTDCPQAAQILTANKTEIDDRDIAWFVLCDESVQTNQSTEIPTSFTSNTTEKYFNRGDVSVILIGKDGGVKRQTDSLELDRLFELIDSMPMRQSEMDN